VNGFPRNLTPWSMGQHIDVIDHFSYLAIAQRVSILCRSDFAAF